MRRILARLAAVRDPGLLLAGCVCFVAAAVMVAVPLGLAVAGVSFIAMDLATSDDDR